MTHSEHCNRMVCKYYSHRQKPQATTLEAAEPLRYLDKQVLTAAGRESTVSTRRQSSSKAAVRPNRNSCLYKNLLQPIFKVSEETEPIIAMLKRDILQAVNIRSTISQDRVMHLNQIQMTCKILPLSTTDDENDYINSRFTTKNSATTTSMHSTPSPTVDS